QHDNLALVLLFPQSLPATVDLANAVLAVSDACHAPNIGNGILILSIEEPSEELRIEVPIEVWDLLLVDWIQQSLSLQDLDSIVGGNNDIVAGITSLELGEQCLDRVIKITSYSGVKALLKDLECVRSEIG